MFAIHEQQLRVYVTMILDIDHFYIAFMLCPEAARGNKMPKNGAAVMLSKLHTSVLSASLEAIVLQAPCI